MSPSRRWLLPLAAAGSLVLAWAPVPRAVASSAGGLAPRTVAQIDALAAAKSARTPAQLKIESALLTAAQLRAGVALPGGVKVTSGVRIDSAGRAAVEVRGTVDAALTARIAALGGHVRSSLPAKGVVRADLPLSAVSSLAALSAVRRISSVSAGAITARIGAPAPATKAERARLLRERLATALRTPPQAIGTVTSEGDRTEGVRAVRRALGLSGVGVTVGVLSDGVSSLGRSIASGDLPPGVKVLPGQAGSGDEGTAMLEIVHDLAPKAKLAFATAFDGADSFAANIRALRAAGADIIVDDVIYFAESSFQDGPIAQAVLDVTADGALYFSSAGNEGNVTDGTSGNYEGDFVDSGQRIGKYRGTAHDFDPGTGVQVVDPLTEGSAGVPVLLQWNDPLGASGNDYDLYAVDSDGNVVAFSNDTQNGDDDAFEIFGVPSGGPYGLVVVKFAGANRYFQVTAFRGRFADDGTHRGYATPGVTRGHSAVPAAFSVAAVPADEPLPFALEPGDPPNPSGPYPGVYTADQKSERFTSDGPRRVFFTPAGQPLTPGNLTSTGGVVRRKPDLSAADGVSTSAPGFEVFFGTSASAPHAAAIAALLVSGAPGITPDQVRAALSGSALDIELPGWDRNTGFGIVMAGPAARASGAQGQPYAVAGAPVVTGSTDGDTFVEPGETAQLRVPVTNAGGRPAADVTATLTSPTPGVTIVPATQPYGTLPAGATASRAFAVRVGPGAALGSAIRLNVRVSFTGGYSPLTTTGRLVVGEPSTEVTTFAYTGPPVAIPDADPVGITVPIRVRGVGPVSKVTFSVDGSTCTTDEGATTVGIDHTYVGDLVGTLRAPDGTRATVFSHSGGSGANMCQVVFTDAADTPFAQASSSDDPFTGEWRPDEPFRVFAGTGGDGTWHFSLADVSGLDTGTLRAVSLHLSGYLPAGG